jgi:chemotaxis protein methyltransferase CheR
MAMAPDDFSFYKKFLYEKSGLALSEDKTYLLESRLSPIARKWNFDSLATLTKNLRATPDQKLLREVVDAMTTNETLFFRDDRPFKYFKTDLLPTLIKSRGARKHLRIWSAACSTGQEPYSIAMTLIDLLPDINSWKIEIIATDLSDSALSQAMRGEYNQFEIQRGLPIQYVMKHFVQSGTTWKINDKIRSMVRFENFNLLEPMDKFGTLDIIFCRNVLIYFDEATKRKLFANFVRRMAPDGYFFLGGSETALGMSTDLKINPACPGLYMLMSAPTSSATIPSKPALTSSSTSTARIITAGT